VSVRDAILVGGALGALAVGGLAWRFNLLSAFLALGALFTYVAIYTPHKRVSTLNTLVGALPGAAPAAIGYAAMTGRIEGWGVALYALVFVWQFPHFMAIAWLYREDYARAGMQMVPSVPGGEPVAGRQALLHALVLLPVSLLPVVWTQAGVVYAVGALLLGLGYCAASAAFALRRTRTRARALLFTSLVYLPAILSLVLFDPVVRLGLRG
jgi:protoheme IX farnesyltransferase